MKEFFGFGGYERPIEGYMSWQHLLFVSILMLIMISLAILLGIKNRNKEAKIKNRVLIIAAILIDLLEIFKIVLISFRSNNPMHFVNDLPLFMCSIQLITIPLAAFSKGRCKEASLDFVFIFGILGAVLGTYAAGNNYSVYPVLSFDNVISGLTHTISGFTALYIAISGMISMKKKNLPITFIIILVFAFLAYTANKINPCNYMFLMRGDGTPYDIVFNLVDGNMMVYPLLVVGLFLIYITVFYLAYYLIVKLINKKRKMA